mmetsp:Transcript_10434/g.13038  ORF Transcript_10434/g.13038 Transcript_10434/m.13038 type:complete len:265 (-) Transcript_10434:95-889(-)|eukprot:CAMPEP_0204822446 /NCGR_PEP_ID=MMETSP1346-20131115/629_1 /ASSEMBLY_ACC=CAM_ASM_000771 /TAXON_ID=215587 /ORGANISM="Aplanochytrium stocchinoi, Strain GSBS06" /LENGTH=264 /DNA_ID=CAMNT_0051948651 /DNA_START=370 /DNA_END=1164 /DNA_ORIENTATION=-
MVSLRARSFVFLVLLCDTIVAYRLFEFPGISFIGEQEAESNTNDEYLPLNIHLRGFLQDMNVPISHTQIWTYNPIGSDAFVQEFDIVHEDKMDDVNMNIVAELMNQMNRIMSTFSSNYFYENDFFNMDENPCSHSRSKPVTRFSMPTENERETQSDDDFYDNIVLQQDQIEKDPDADAEKNYDYRIKIGGHFRNHHFFVILVMFIVIFLATGVLLLCIMFLKRRASDSTNARAEAEYIGLGYLPMQDKEVSSVVNEQPDLKIPQ